MATPTTPEDIAQMMEAAHELFVDPVAQQMAVGSMIAGGRSFMDFFGDKHLYVRYHASTACAFVEDPDTFYFARPSPSDSRWMVPGT